MHIRCWGARGSLPVSGRQFTKYGGDTTCIEVRSGRGDLLIIDAGSGIRALGYALVNEPVKKITIIFTHAHIDHLMGFPFFLPLFSSKISLHIGGPRLNKKSYKEVLGDFLEQPYFPVQLGDKDIRSTLNFFDISEEPFMVGNLRITPIALSHPKNGGLGYRISEGKKSFVFLTDNELGYIHKGGKDFEEYARFCENTDLLIHDAEYTRKDYRHILTVSERPWGHSLFTDATYLALDANAKRFGLFHHNQKRTDTQVDAMVKQAQAIIKKRKSGLQCFAVGHCFSVTL
jgi:phosphoribosyl 1,2-cyclic phosphodiesterase